jgi:TetR/AcrR family transcriptional regulator, cholesterol catabolism regulator
MTDSTEMKSTPGRRKWIGGYDPPRTRRALVDSALGLFEQEGFYRTSLQEIVDGAGLTKGAFYHHFNSKEDVLWEIQNEYLDVQIQAAKSILSRHQGDCVALLRELIRLSLTGVAGYRAHVSIFYQERRHLTGERLKIITEKRDTRVQLFRETIRRGIEDGTFKPNTNATIAAFGILGMCALAVQWFDPNGTLTIDDIADQFCDLVLDGLLS